MFKEKEKKNFLLFLKLIYKYIFVFYIFSYASSLQKPHGFNSWGLWTSMAGSRSPNSPRSEFRDAVGRFGTQVVRYDVIFLFWKKKKIFYLYKLLCVIWLLSFFPDQVLIPLNTYQGQFPEMRKKIEKRGRKLIDFDKERHNVQTLQGNPNRNEAKYARYFYNYLFLQIS